MPCGVQTSIQPSSSVAGILRPFAVSTWSTRQCRLRRTPTPGSRSPMVRSRAWCPLSVTSDRVLSLATSTPPISGHLCLSLCTRVKSLNQGRIHCCLSNRPGVSLWFVFITILLFKLPYYSVLHLILLFLFKFIACLHFHNFCLWYLCCVGFCGWGVCLL